MFFRMPHSFGMGVLISMNDGGLVQAFSKSSASFKGNSAPVFSLYLATGLQPA